MSLYLEYINIKHQKILALLPFEVFLVISNADGVIAKEEFEQFLHLIEKTTWAHSKHIKQICEKALLHITKLKHYFEFNNKYKNAKVKGDIQHIQSAIRTAEWLLTPAEITLLIEDLSYFSREIAKSSVEEKSNSDISPEEQKTLDQLKKLFKEPHSETVSLRNLIVELPFQLFLLVSDADENIDKEERDQFIKILANRNWCKSYVGQTIFTQTSGLVKRFFERYQAGKIEKSFSSIDNTIRLADKVFSAQEMKILKVDLFNMVKKVAEASGGFAGVSTISKEEEKVLSRLQPLLFPDDSPRNESKLEKNKDHVISIDSSGDVREAVTQKQLRNQPRAKSPLDVEVTFYLNFGETILEAKLLNLSDSGMLCEIEILDHDTSFFQPTRASLRFPKSFEYESIENIQCKLIRIQVDTWDEDFLPTKVKVAVQFMTFPDKGNEKYFKNLDKINEEK